MVYETMNNVEESITKCNSIDELIRYLITIPGITGSYKFYSSPVLVQYVNEVTKGFAFPNKLTRSCGLRKKVLQLSNMSEEFINKFCPLD